MTGLSPGVVSCLPEPRICLKSGTEAAWFGSWGEGWLHRGSCYEHHVDRFRVLHGHPNPHPEGLRWIRPGVYFLFSALHHPAALLVTTLHHLGAAFTLRPDASPVLLKPILDPLPPSSLTIDRFPRPPITSHLLPSSSVFLGVHCINHFVLRTLPSVATVDVDRPYQSTPIMDCPARSHVIQVSSRNAP
jgi:hypothetical protein